MKKIIRLVFVATISLFIIGIFLRNPVIVLDELRKVDNSQLKENLQNHVRFLTSLSPYRNHLNIQSLDRAAVYIQQEFEKNCDEVGQQEFVVNDKTYKNVICLFRGQASERIVIGAHYDVAHEQSGADDNASGVATIIELSRLLKEKQSFPHDVEIVAYTLEEPPYFRTEKMGSYHHAKAISLLGVKVKFMISVEMVGYYSDELWSQSYPLHALYLFYPWRGNFVGLLGGFKEYFGIRQIKASMSEAMSLPVLSFNGPAAIHGLDFSDHLNYWEMGYEAFMLTDTSFFRNKNYHKKTDTIETLNFNAMAEVVRGLSQAISPLAKGER